MYNKSIHIILDVTRVMRRRVKGQTLTGIDRVTMAYVQHYKQTARALVRWCGRSWLLSQPQSEALFTWLAKPCSAFAAILIIIKGIVTSVRLKRSDHTILINTGHIGLGQSDYVRLMRNHGVQPVFFVHDLIPITYPEYCSVGEDVRHREKMNYILTHAAGVITNSEATLCDLKEYAQQTNQVMPPFEVALLASGISLYTADSRPMSKPYFVMLSTIEPRKNHILLLQIWRSLFQNLGAATPHLVVIGQRGWECENAVDLLDRCPSLKEVVTEVSHCSDAQLVTYLQHSQALLFPSFIEGYGLPLIEALALGVPVIASDLPVFHEIADDIPEYIDPLDGMRWKECILEYAKPNSLLREAQIQRMRSFTGPTWIEHFMKVDAFLETKQSTSTPC